MAGPEASAAQLGWIRAVVAAVVLTSADVHGAVSWAGGLSHDQLGWARPFAAAPVVGAAWILSVGGASFGMVGFRAGFAAATVGLLVLLGLRQVGSGPVHAHHLVWLTAILAAGPAPVRHGDDRWARWIGAPVQSSAHEVTVRSVWAVLGVVYFFPGLHKLAGDWVTGDALVQTLWWKWAQSPGFTPAVRLDLYPGLARAASVAVVVFELSVGPALQVRRTRPWAAAAIVGFHAGTAWVANIPFSSLWLLALTALPVGSAGPVVARSRRAPIWAAGGVLVPAAIAGLLGAQVGWPFACYPTFARAPGLWMPTVVVREVTATGERPVVLDGAMRTTGELWALRTPSDAAAFRARHPEVPEHARFYRASRAVRPGDDRVLLGEPFAELTPAAGERGAAR